MNSKLEYEISSLPNNNNNNVNNSLNPKQYLNFRDEMTDFL